MEDFNNISEGFASEKFPQELNGLRNKTKEVFGTNIWRSGHFVGFLAMLGKGHQVLVTHGINAPFELTISYHIWSTRRELRMPDTGYIDFSNNSFHCNTEESNGGMSEEGRLPNSGTTAIEGIMKLLGKIQNNQNRDRNKNPIYTRYK